MIGEFCFFSEVQSQNQGARREVFQYEATEGDDDGGRKKDDELMQQLNSVDQGLSSQETRLINGVGNFIKAGTSPQDQHTRKLETQQGKIQVAICYEKWHGSLNAQVRLTVLCGN